MTFRFHRHLLRVWRPKHGPTRFGADHHHSPVNGHTFLVSLRWLMIRVVW